MNKKSKIIIVCSSLVIIFSALITLMFTNKQAAYNKEASAIVAQTRSKQKQLDDINQQKNAQIQINNHLNDKVSASSKKSDNKLKVSNDALKSIDIIKVNGEKMMSLLFTSASSDSEKAHTKQMQDAKKYATDDVINTAPLFIPGTKRTVSDVIVTTISQKDNQMQGLIIAEIDSSTKQKLSNNTKTAYRYTYDMKSNKFTKLESVGVISRN